MSVRALHSAGFNKLFEDLQLSPAWNQLSRPGCEPLTCLQTTDTSGVDVCTKPSISHSHYTLISHLLQQNMEVKVVLLQAKKAARKFESRDIFKDTCGHFQVFFTGSWTICDSDCGDRTGTIRHTMF